MMRRAMNLHPILSRYPVPFARLTETPASVGGGFSGALIFRIESEAGVFCLRGWPTDGPPVERIRGLHALLEHVHERGVGQVAVPVRSRDETTIFESRGRLWQLEPWMPGVAAFHDEPNDARLKSAASCLAEFHTAAESFTPPASATRWFYQRSHAPSPAVMRRARLLAGWRRGRLDRAAACIERTLPSSFRELTCELVGVVRRSGEDVARDLDSVSRLRFRLQPCLRDVWRDHVLFSGDEATGLIDASAASSDNVATDLARLFGSLVDNDDARWRTALEAYQLKRLLEPNELELTRVLDRSGLLLSGLTWLDREYLRGGECAKSPKVVERLAEIVGRLRTDFASRKS